MSTHTSTWTVTGMTCGHCVASVTEEIAEIDGVETVDVTLESGEVVVTSNAAARAGQRRARRQRGGLRADVMTHRPRPAPLPQAGADVDVDLAITGMTCASCANRIERKLNKLEGVSATVNYATEKAHVVAPGARSAPTCCSRPSRRRGYAASVPEPRRRRRRGRPSASSHALRRRLVVSAVLGRAGGRAGDGAGAGSSTAGRGSRWCWPPPWCCGAPGPSTARRRPTCATAPRRWTPWSPWASRRRTCGRWSRSCSATPGCPA